MVSFSIFKVEETINPYGLTFFIFIFFILQLICLAVLLSFSAYALCLC